MTTATDIINEARAYGSDTFANAADLVTAAAKIVETGRAYKPPFDWEAGAYELTPEYPDRVPEYDFTYDKPVNEAEEPQFQEPSKADKPNEIEDFKDFEKGSNWFTGDAPIYNIPPFSKSAPTISDYTFPDMPDYKDVPYPDLIDPIAIPTFGGVTIPEFDEELLAPMPGLPGNIVDEYKNAYNNMLPEMKAFIDSGMEEFLNKYAPEYEDNRSRLVGKINAIFDGGTGISVAVEQGIYERGRSKTEAENNRLDDEVKEQAAKAGMYIPPGAIIAARQDMAKAAAMSNAQYSSEVVIERTKLELDHLQFAMSLSNTMRESALTYSLQYTNVLAQINGQALQFAQTLSNVMVELYNLELKRFEAALSYLQIQAQIYEVKFKASLANLEIYKIEMEAAKLQVDMNGQLIEQYSLQIEAEKTKAEYYKIQVDTIVAQINAEAEEVKAFGVEVDAYNATVGAKTAEYGAYSAALEGNKSQVDAYVAEATAYKTKVSAEVSRAEITAQNNAAVNSYNSSALAKYQAELTAYTTEIKQEESRSSIAASKYKTDMEGWKTILQLEELELKSKVGVAKMDLDAALGYYRATANFNIENVRLQLNSSKNVADVALAGAKVYTDIAGSAISAQNTMVTLVEKGE